MIHGLVKIIILLHYEKPQTTIFKTFDTHIGLCAFFWFWRTVVTLRLHIKLFPLENCVMWIAILHRSFLSYQRLLCFTLIAILIFLFFHFKTSLNQPLLLDKSNFAIQVKPLHSTFFSVKSSSRKITKNMFLLLYVFYISGKERVHCFFFYSHKSMDTVT